MSGLKWIVWRGEPRELPGLGVAQPGEPLALPADQAQDYIGQGLAEAAPPRRRKATTGATSATSEE